MRELLVLEKTGIWLAPELEGAAETVTDWYNGFCQHDISSFMVVAEWSGVDMKDLPIRLNYPSFR